MNLLDDLGLCVINDGSFTRLARPGQSRSCLDLTMCSARLAADLVWKRLNLTHGSDHYPICTTLTTRCLPQKENPPLLKYRLSGARWDLYSQILEDAILTLPQVSPNNLDVCISQLSDAISSAADESIPLKNSASGKISSPPWWDRECTSIIKLRNEAEQSYALNMAIENLVEYNRIVARSRRLFKKKKYEGWKKFCSSLSPSTPSSMIWQNFRRFKKEVYNSMVLLMSERNHKMSRFRHGS